MPRIEFSVDSDVPAERVFAAITDFSDDRTRLWPHISPEVYKLHGQGEGWAEATEGETTMGGIWAKERYAWSPGHVKATVIDSNIFKSGVWEMKVTPRDGGGSRIEILNHRKVKGKGLLVAPVLMLAGKRILTKALNDTLDVLRAETPDREGVGA
jgi:hypothetical protein